MPQDGVIRVEDLLRSPALQLRLIAGEPGVSRRVAWAHVSELEDPTPWLFGSEMIMTTGIAIPGSAGRQRAYLERLDDAGVACLAVSEQLFVPPLTKAFLAAAGERGFPVVEVPIAVPFMAISQEVAAAVQVDTGQRLNAQLQVFGAVRWLAAGNLSTQEIFARLERLSGYRLYACTTRRGPLLDGVPVPPPDQARLIPGTPTSPPTVPGGYVLPVSGPRGTAGYILAMETAGAAPAGVSVVQHIATVAALQLSMQAHEREMLRREGAETLTEMLRGVLDEAIVARRLAVHGFPAGARLVLAIVRPKDPGASCDTVVDALAQGRFPQLVLRQEEELYVLIPDDRAARAALAASDTITGASLPFRAGAPLGVARREAQWAIARAVESGKNMISYGDDRTGRWLTSESADLQALVDDVLRAVIDYDDAHGGDLLPTIRIWLEHDRQTDKAAQALHIHPNTLLYRVRRFEQITGRSLTSTEALAETWLALRAAATLPSR
ncbi:MAG TPA: PucR family transcriptional regulator ligand-binding domain-containing protein [Streptosporangiaceae bacterium]|nr:PucR family transcriptional regulator ligand-binding domain-containing protein [Streptosporangiaceae bacterium]